MGAADIPTAAATGGATEGEEPPSVTERLSDCRLDCPVVSIGNLTMGGTGKTPAVILATETLIALGDGVLGPMRRTVQEFQKAEGLNLTGRAGHRNDGPTAGGRHGRHPERVAS